MGGRSSFWTDLHDNIQSPEGWCEYKRATETIVLLNELNETGEEGETEPQRPHSP